MSNKGLVSRIYKVYLEFTNKKTTHFLSGRRAQEIKTKSNVDPRQNLETVK